MLKSLETKSHKGKKMEECPSPMENNKGSLVHYALFIQGDLLQEPPEICVDVLACEC